MRALLLSAVASVVCAVAGAAQEVDYAGSMQVSSGSYIFTSPTRTLSLVNGLAVTLGRIRFSTHVPLILQNSGGVTVVGGAMLPTGGTGSGAVSGRQQGRPVPLGRGTPRAGATSGTATTADSIVHDPGRYRMVLGDPFVAAGLELYRGVGSLRIVEVSAGVKVPVTDVESGVGTGEWDWTAGVAVALAAGPALVFADAGYWWYGDMADLALRDGVSLSLGVAVPVSPSVWLSGSFMGTNRVIGTAAPMRTASLGASYRVTDRTGVSVTMGAGVSETSPDWFMSVGWSWRLRDAAPVP